MECCFVANEARIDLVQIICGEGGEVSLWHIGKEKYCAICLNLKLCSEKTQ